MSTLKSSAEDLTLNADGSGNDVIIQSDGSTKMTIVDTGYVEMAGATDVRLTLGSTGTAGTNDASWLRGNGADLLYNSASGDHKWEVGGTEKLRIQAAGGISFNGDTAAANALDDYEEGAHTVTFTPVTSGTVTLTGAQNTLGYTKIGRLVTITGEINVASVSSPVGGIRMSLPFVIAANATDRDSNFGSPTLAYSVPFSAGHPPSVYGSSNTSYVSLLFMSDNGAFGNYTPAAGESFFFSFSYITTA